MTDFSIFVTGFNWKLLVSLWAWKNAFLRSEMFFVYEYSQRLGNCAAGKKLSIVTEEKSRCHLSVKIVLGKLNFRYIYSIGTHGSVFLHSQCCSRWRFKSGRWKFHDRWWLLRPSWRQLPTSKILKYDHSKWIV